MDCQNYIDKTPPSALPIELVLPGRHSSPFKSEMRFAMRVVAFSQFQVFVANFM